MNPFYKNIPQHPLVAKFPTVQSVVEELYLAAIVDAHQRIQAIPGIGQLKENLIRNEIVRDFRFNNPVISNYFKSKIITLSAENQAYTATLEQRTDLEIHNGHHQHIFVIECKKLRSAESRYVHGRTIKGTYQHDGLEKFIDLTYAETDLEGAMLSFVVGSNPGLIVNSLVVKVLTFHPSSTCVHLSNQRCIGWSLSFQSSHICSNGKEFRLYHLFYDLR